MPTADELMRIARDAIGEGDSDTDWKIVPTEHARMFEKEAPSLAENLRGTRPQGLAQMYEKSNAKAMTAQKDFRNAVHKANAAVFWAASFGALLLVAGGLQALLGRSGPWLVRVIGLVGFIASGLAALWLSRVRGGALSKCWTEDRAKAEAKRLAYFKAVIEGASNTPLDQLLALEYTRRFLLDNQIDYFEGRGGKHRDAAGIALKNSTFAVFVSSLLTALAGVLSMWRPEFTVIAGLGVIASAYAALVASRSAVEQHRENAHRYRAVEDLLAERKLDLDIYRRKTASGGQGAVQEFFEPIFIALRAHHQAFLSDGEKRELAIAGMERRLDDAQEASKKKPADGADKSEPLGA